MLLTAVTGYRDIRGPTLFEYLETVESTDPDRASGSFYLPVQWIVWPNLPSEDFCGTVAANGRLLPVLLSIHCQAVKKPDQEKSAVPEKLSFAHTVMSQLLLDLPSGHQVQFAFLSFARF